VTIPQPSDDSIENIGVTFLSASYRREIASALRAFEKLSNHLFRFVLTRVQLVSSVHFIDRFDADILKASICFNMLEKSNLNVQHAPQIQSSFRVKQYFQTNVSKQTRTPSRQSTQQHTFSWCFVDGA